MRYKHIAIYDLDQTVINSSHREKRLPSGEIDLSHWKEFESPEFIWKDGLLPLAHKMKTDLKTPGVFVAVCTMRGMMDCEREFLNHHSIFPDYLIHRTEDNPDITSFKRDAILNLLESLNVPRFRYSSVTLYEDHADVLVMARDLGINAVNAPEWNADFLREIEGKFKHA